jgi:hypothetical protein
MRIGISPAVMTDVTEITNKLTTYKFTQLNLGSTGDLIAGFKTVDATLVFLEKSLKDTTKLNLRK